MSKLYLAYGSNLSLAQMAHRCPDAIPVGIATLENFHLLFKGSRSGNYLTIEPEADSYVPVAVWRISTRDEGALDRYEGCPTFYYKTTLPITVEGIPGSYLHAYDAEGIIYIMHEDRETGTPSFNYYNTCSEGYSRFGFSKSLLRKAVIDSIGEKEGKKWCRAYRDWFTSNWWND